MVTPMHSVLDEARRLAEERGLVVTGSEVVGLIPYQALIETGKHYLRMQGKSTGVPATDILRTAVFSLGLNDTSEFDVKKKVLGLPQTPEDALVCMKVNDFADEISRGTPTPGGGSVAAIGGAFGASLVSMVANLAHGKPANEKQNQDLNTIAERAQALKDLLIKAVDTDARAFRIYLKTLSLPSTTLEEQEVREQEIQQGLKTAVEVPWQTALTSFESLKLAQQTIQEVDTEAITDVAVGAQIGFVGVRGGIWNVLINLKKIRDRKYITEMCKNCNDLLCDATNILNSVTAYVDKQVRESICSG
jgi:glutamate formiminotransferase/formiminotetrahydrofolate cyclodeaminase